MLDEVMEMCQRNHLLSYIKPLDDKIHKIYSGVKEIKHRILALPDSDFPERLRFEIYLSGDPKEILKDEKIFHKDFFRIVPEDKQEFFSFTYRIT